MTIEELSQMLDDNLGPFVRVVPDFEGDFVGKRGIVYDTSTGALMFRVWPSPFKDMNFDIKSAEVTSQGAIEAVTSQGKILIRTAPTPAGAE